MEENQNIQQPTVQYTEDNVIHLSDMEHVRTRPGMYIGRLGDGSHAEDGIYVLLKEVIDNSIDEFKMNAGKRIEVTVEDNLRCTIRDYGRGIPQGKLVEAVSMLNTGGKYDSKAFKKSVGLNGVGLKAVNALSRHFEARSYRDGQVRCTTFECGKLITDVTEPTDDETGTYIYFEPDPSLFKHYSFRGEFVEEMLRNYTYLNTGLTIMFNGRRILSRNGLSDLLTDRMTATALYDIVHLKGEDIEIAFTHCNQNGEEYYSFVNGQHTTLGGTHQAAFKKYIAEVIKEYSGKSYDYSDIRNGMVAAISINIQEPLFESQTKIKLGSLTTEPDGGISIDKFIGDFVKSQVDNFLHKNTDVADVILQKVSESERERKAMAGVAKKAREMSKKANLHNRKLRDCRIHLNDAVLIVVREVHHVRKSDVAAADPGLLEKLSVRRVEMVLARLDLAAYQVELPFVRVLESFAKQQPALIRAVDHDAVVSGDLRLCWLQCLHQELHPEPERHAVYCICTARRI